MINYKEEIYKLFENTDFKVDFIECQGKYLIRGQRALLLTNLKNDRVVEYYYTSEYDLKIIYNYFSMR